MRTRESSDIARPAARSRRGVESVREHNLAVVLGLVAGRAGLSRAEIATESGLTRATVSRLVETLLEDGLIEETGTANNGRTGAGRPATGLAVATDGIVGLGIEINVDYVATCVLDLGGGVRSAEVVTGDQRGRTPARTLRTVTRLAEAAITDASSAGLRVAGVGVAVPGLVRAPDGPLVVAPNLGWHDVDVLGRLRRSPVLAELPLTLDNEANCAARSEMTRPGTVPTGSGDFVYVFGEVGVGAALVLGGALLRGTHGWSGELGHVTVDPHGPPCTCGARGCLEQYVGLEAILRAGRVRPASATGPAGTAPALERIVALAERESPRIVAALADAGRALGIALAAAVNLLDVDELVLGGSLRPLEPWLRPTLMRELDDRVVSRPWASMTVRPASLATEAAVTGAATSVTHAVIDHPSAWARR